MNDLGQSIGFPVGFESARLPQDAPLTGSWCKLFPVDVRRDAADLHAAYALDSSGADWTYLPYGPFATSDTFAEWLELAVAQEAQFLYTVVNSTGVAAGMLGFLNVSTDQGSIEIGHVHYSPLLQRTAAATEAIYLLARLAFEELGYRRLEWKCDALNERSRASAKRLGFRFEGEFRQHRVYKGRNRDTAWFSILDHEWPKRRLAFQRWLDPSNFDVGGIQKRTLSEM